MQTVTTADKRYPGVLFCSVAYIIRIVRGQTPVAVHNWDRRVHHWTRGPIRCGVTFTPRLYPSWRDIYPTVISVMVWHLPRGYIHHGVTFTPRLYPLLRDIYLDSLRAWRYPVCGAPNCSLLSSTAESCRGEGSGGWGWGNGGVSWGQIQQKSETLGTRATSSDRVYMVLISKLCTHR